MMAKLILFDGDCNFCNQNVLFILKYDKQNQFKFCSLQSDIAKSLLKKHDLSTKINSLVLIDEKTAYTKSTAVLHISRHLTFPWKSLYCFIIIPKKVRDLIYSFIANNRYKIFKQKDKCIIPTNDMKRRFL